MQGLPEAIPQRTAPCLKSIEALRQGATVL